MQGNGGARLGRCAAGLLIVVACGNDELVEPDATFEILPSGEGGAGVAAPEPLLEGLQVDGVRTALTPEFDPTRDRYSVIALEAETPNVTATVRDGLVVAVNGRVAQSGGTVNVNRSGEGPAISIVVRNALGASHTYTVQILPPDFPELEVTVSEEGASTDPIYLSLHRVSDTAGFLAKVDNYGVPYFYRRIDAEIFDFKKHVRGEVSYAERRESDAEHVILDEHLNPVLRLQTVGLLDTDIHDFHVLESGNYAMLAYERATRDLSAFGGSTSEQVVDGIFQEVTPSGDVVFQWSTKDHLDMSERLVEEFLDYAHVNSVWPTRDGHWLVSSRSYSQVLKIDGQSGEVIWRLGGIASDFSFVDDPREGICGQHTASETPDGTILVFDNGWHCVPGGPPRHHVARAAEYALDLDARTATLVFSHENPDLNAGAQGSAQRLPSGNTFIGWGVALDLLASEVDREGNVVFGLRSKATQSRSLSYRAQRFAD